MTAGKKIKHFRNFRAISQEARKRSDRFPASIPPQLKNMNMASATPNPANCRKLQVLWVPVSTLSEILKQKKTMRKNIGSFSSLDMLPDLGLSEHYFSSEIRIIGKNKISKVKKEPKYPLHTLQLVKKPYTYLKAKQLQENIETNKYNFNEEQQDEAYNFLMENISFGKRWLYGI